MNNGEIHALSTEECLEMREEIIGLGEGVTQWEEEFLSGLEEYLDLAGEFTYKQKQTIERIYKQRVVG